MTDIEKAVEYFEDAVRETDEIISECSPALQKELTEQKEHFVVALEALQEKAERDNNPPLTIEQLKKMNGSPVWCVDSRGDGKWALVHSGDEVCTDADFGDWEFHCYGWKDGKKLNENGWLAYRYKKEG